MDPITIATGVTAGLGFLNSFLQKDTAEKNVAAQEKINQQNIDFARQTNLQNRAWALEDWNRTSMYNSPAQQMQRLREAGLNPNLVYGNGAQNTAQMVSRTEAKSPDLKAPQHIPLQLPELGGELSRYVAVKQAQAQIETAKAQQLLLGKQAVQADAKTAAILQGTAKTAVQTKLANSLFDSTVEAATLRNEATKTGILSTQTSTALKVPEFQLKTAQFELAKARTDAEIVSITARTLKTMFESSTLLPQQVAKMKQEVENMKVNNDLQKFLLGMRKMGINPNDPIYIRMIGLLGEKMSSDLLSNATQDDYVNKSLRNFNQNKK